MVNRLLHLVELALSRWQHSVRFHARMVPGPQSVQTRCGAQAMVRTVPIRVLRFETKCSALARSYHPPGLLVWPGGEGADQLVVSFAAEPLSANHLPQRGHSTPDSATADIGGRA